MRHDLRLNHANVVQTFDIGVSDSAYFLVMEWIDGTQPKLVNEVARPDGYNLKTPSRVHRRRGMQSAQHTSKTR